jgi:hypothetical protein
MTAVIFREWLAGVDARMGGQNRKILLFLDRCSAHNLEGLNLRNVRVVFLPANYCGRVSL